MDSLFFEQDVNQAMKNNKYIGWCNRKPISGGESGPSTHTDEAILIASITYNHHIPYDPDSSPLYDSFCGHQYDQTSGTMILILISLGFLEWVWAAPSFFLLLGHLPPSTFHLLGHLPPSRTPAYTLKSCSISNSSLNFWTTLFVWHTNLTK